MEHRSNLNIEIGLPICYRIHYQAEMYGTSTPTSAKALALSLSPVQPSLLVSHTVVELLPHKEAAKLRVSRTRHHKRCAEGLENGLLRRAETAEIRKGLKRDLTRDFG